MAYEFSWVEIRDMWWTFNKYDTDSSGSLSRSEVQQLIKNEIKNASSDDFNWILSMVDSEGGASGLSFGQYVHIVGEFGKRGFRDKQPAQPHFNHEDIGFLYDLFIKCDQKGDRLLDFAELQAAVSVFNPKPDTPTATSALIKRLAIESVAFDDARFLKGLAFSDINYKAVTRNKNTKNAQLNIERDTSNSRVPPKLSLVRSDMATIPDKLKSDAMRVFNSADTDRNGAIDGDEFFRALKNLFPKMTRPECNRIYAETDSNRSGLITYDEFLEAAIQFHWDLSRLVAPTSGPAPAAYEWEVPFKELELGAVLGEGSFGVVHKAKWRGTTVAVKILKLNKANDDILQDFRREIAFLGRLRHPNVVLFMGAATQPPNIAMVTEFLSGGSLYDVLHKRKKKLDTKSILRIGLQTARALNHLHLSGIIHRDVKSMNVLIDDSWNLKVIDFGLSIVKPSPSALLNEQVGSPLWMAPELLLGKQYNEKVDVFSFAICMWELLTNNLPYAGMDLIGVVNFVARNNKRPSIPTTCPHQLSQLINQCWDAKPESRPTFDSVIKSLEQMAKVLV